MTPCTFCGARAQTFLCGRCTADARDTLTGLVVGPELPNGHRGAGWLAKLADAAHGQTRLGESARRSTDNGSPMLCNLKASALLDTVRNMLSTWVRDLCDVRGIDCPALGPNEIPMAAWLCKHVDAIGLHPGAGEFLEELNQRVEEIERAINRPVDDMFCGHCPTIMDDQEPCAESLYARWEYKLEHHEVEIHCRGCDHTHKTDALLARAFDTAWELYTEVEVFETMRSVGQDIPLRTWRYWRKSGKLQSRNELGVEPKYWLHEVWALLAAKPQKQVTGAAAYRQEEIA
jgi:hypothetical protein